MILTGLFGALFGGLIVGLFSLYFSRRHRHHNQSMPSPADHHLLTILEPFKQRLSDFKETVLATQQHEQYARASLTGELKQLVQLNQTLANEAKQLTQALKGNTKIQGNWGELVLESVLERAGLQKGVEFTTQKSLISDSGRRQQPDVIIHLPDKRHIIIDSKVSLTAYTAYCASETEADQKRALKAHIDSVQQHISQLGEKNYPDLITSPDFVLAFMPIEPAYSLAVQADPSLCYKAMDQNVVIVSASTLLATLKLVASMWQHTRQSKNAQLIAQQGGALYDKFALFLAEFDKLGAQLNTALSTYQGVHSKLVSGKGNILKRAKDLKELGVKTSRSLPDHV